MTDLTSNSQVFTASATEQHAEFTDYFNEVIVVNGDTKSIWVSTDGSTTTDAEAGSVEVPAGTSAQIANEQVKTYPFTVGAGGDSNGYGTSQSNTPASGYGTYVSFISDASPGTGKIVVSAQ